MQYAIVDCRRETATPGARGHCPSCNGEVIAHCGLINVWHWSHLCGTDCDPWSEGESEWHLNWKRRFPSRWREFTMDLHRADVKSPTAVVELQASSISVDEIAEREAFYGSMIWVVDAREFNLTFRYHDRYVTFRWKHPRKTWWYRTKPLYLDLGPRLLQVHNIHRKLPCWGSGRFVSHDEFVKRWSVTRHGDLLCDWCRMPFAASKLTKTGMYEYYTMDMDLETTVCYDCYEARRESRIPEDPDCFDGWTPLVSHAI